MARRRQFMTGENTIVSGTMNTFSRNRSSSTATVGLHRNTHRAGTNILSLSRGELRHGRLQFNPVRGQRGLAALQRLKRVNQGHYTLAGLRNGRHAIAIRDPRFLKPSTGHSGG